MLRLCLNQCLSLVVVHPIPWFKPISHKMLFLGPMSCSSLWHPTFTFLVLRT